ncbi:hypothetical protein DVS77_21630 [Mycolicibacterium moriokaense]|nr:hypothetical protein DVS77_21630 [Mycolicibacterium moriokaense]
MLLAMSDAAWMAFGIISPFFGHQFISSFCDVIDLVFELNGYLNKPVGGTLDLFSNVLPLMNR